MSPYVKRAAAGVSTLALLFTASSVGTFAQANEITSVNFAAEVANNANVNTAFTFTVPAAGDLGTGESVVVRVPDDLTVTYDAGTIAADVVFTSSGTIGNGSVAYDTVSREITYTLAGADAVAAAETVTVTFNNDFVATPAGDNTSGQYAFAIRTEDTANVVDDTGVAILSVNNTVDMVAVVQEALTLTIDDTSVNLAADPSANNGEDYSQRTVLTAATNAKDGYVIQAALADGNDGSTAQLYNSDAASFLASGDAESTENTFGYIAYNGNGSSLEQAVGSAGRTAMDNNVTRTQAELKSDASAVTAFGNSATTLLPVTAAGGDVVPGNGSTNVAYDGPINTSQHTIYYAMNVDFLTAAGTYTGTITYTAVTSF